jgi:hypothetical protein
MRPLKTVRQLIAFAQLQAEKQASDSSDWQRVCEELSNVQTPLDMTIAVARFKAVADERRWLGS